MAAIPQTVAGSDPSVVPASAPEASYMDWQVIFAGAVTSAALFTLFTTFGGAVGLSVASPWSGASATSLGIIAAIWFLIVQIGSFAAGGYLAGRMRRRIGDANPDEVEFRDGAHGFLVWGVGFLFSVWLVAMTTSAVVQTGVQAGAAAMGAAASRNGGGGDAFGYAVDSMFRSTQAPAQGQGADPRAEAGRIIAAAVTRGELTAADRTYLGQVVAQRTGIPAPEAEQRVTQAFNQAREYADRTRKVGAITGFLIAASLIVSAAAACFAAQTGGTHRDQGTVSPWLRRRFTA